MASAVRNGHKESAAIWQANAAMREAGFGDKSEARKLAEKALKLVPGQAVEIESAFAQSIVGDRAQAAALAQDLDRRFPTDTQMQTLWLPTIRAQLALERGDTAGALNHLHAAASMDLASIQFLTNVSCLYPVYVRGEAYLAAGKGSAAAVEFQRILDHSGITWNCWTGALARLGLARAYRLEADSGGAAHDSATHASAVGKARSAYQDFLALWKDADADIPVLQQARAEYARLQ
jgi:tetratricopeptide (TPR) repeat protein